MISDPGRIKMSFHQLKTLMNGSQKSFAGYLGTWTVGKCPTKLNVRWHRYSSLTRIKRENVIVHNTLCRISQPQAGFSGASFHYPVSHIIAVSVLEKKAEGYALMIYCLRALLKQGDSSLERRTTNDACADNHSSI